MKRIDISKMVRENLTEEEISDILFDYDEAIETQKERSREIRQAERLRKLKRRNQHESRESHLPIPRGHEGPSNEATGPTEEPNDYPR